MTCKLCLLEKPLQRSHIIPEFFYRPLYDDKHKIYGRLGAKKAGLPPLQKGLREPLLCWDCEQKLSPYERYNREILYGGTHVTLERKTKGMDVTGLDYQKVRVFQLSLLWRMSVATHRFWKEVDLGHHEDTVRDMVFREDPGEPDEYGTYCVAPLFDGQILYDFMLQPDVVISQRGRYYRVVLGGILFMFYVSDKRLTEVGKKLCINRDGSWFILVKDAWEIEFLREDAKKISGI